MELYFYNRLNTPNLSTAKGGMDMKRMAYEDYTDVLNAEQLAAMLGISRAGAYQLMNRADFPTLCIGKRKLAPKDKVLAWIDRQTRR